MTTHTETLSTTPNDHTNDPPNRATDADVIGVDHVTGAPLDPGDPRIAFAHAVQTAGAVVGRVDQDNAHDPSPCAEWDAATVARHLVAMLHRVGALPGGADLETLPLVADDVPLDDLADAFEGGARALEDAWSDPSLLDRVMRLPFAELPGAAALRVYAAEILIHTWDLAAAIGVDPLWCDPDVEVAVGVVHDGIPAEPRGVDTMPFDPVVDVPATARPIERLVAWVGRDPARWNR